MKTAFIIRFHYDQDDPRFEWRLAYFRTMVLPRILAQTDQRFDIAIRCNKWHEDIFRSLSPRIKTFSVKNEMARYKQNSGRRYFLDFVSWSDVENLERYDLQLGLDSDDLISENYLAKVISAIRERSPNESLHLSFQPQLFDLKTLSIKEMSQRYHSKKGSAFFALYQPKKEKYIFAYEDSHLRLWKYVSQSITLPAGYCYATCHQLNESTHA